MYKPKFLVGIVLACYVLFAVFEFSGNGTVAFYFKSFMVPFIAIAYTFYVNPKNNLFWAFLICYSLSDLLAIGFGELPFFTPEEVKNYDYFIGNGLYMLSYLFLIFKIVRLTNFKYVFKNLKLYSIVLVFLNVYLFYVLNSFIEPNLTYQVDYYFECVYNVIILTLFFVGMINFFCRDNQKSLFLFLGSLSIVLSEIMAIAYLYIGQRELLNFLSTTFALIAFNLFYYQTSLSNVNTKESSFIYKD
ncbi:MAG: hypothetical protein ABJM36_03455 [Algibacter sp.]|uniref:hypothetical protein n=1 Tax=Algibacter sp. TaxID=1872428 RepID=UPI00329853F4